MTDEQNKPVRSRDEQVVDLGARIFVGMRNHTDSMCEAQRHIDEAEARGAAEQRRKDVEGQEPVAWLIQDKNKGKSDCAYSPDRAVTDQSHATLAAKFNNNVFGLYTRPANVAALENRVRELEKENTRLKTAQFYGSDEEEGGSEDISSFFDDHEPGTILEIDGYRHVNTKWVLWDGNSPHVFDTEDEATAALTRTGTPS